MFVLIVKLGEFSEAASLLKDSLEIAISLKDTKTHEAIKKRLEHVNSKLINA